MSVANTTDCEACKKLHEVKCDICDTVLGTEKRQCSEHD